MLIYHRIAPYYIPDGDGHCGFLHITVNVIVVCVYCEAKNIDLCHLVVCDFTFN